MTSRNSRSSVADLAAGIHAGNRRDAGRAISLVENDSDLAEQLIRRIFAQTGRAYSVGFTGPPGAGKSTLVDDLVHIVRVDGQTIGVIAVDPNSPFSGGAILGDRIRMMRHTVDEGVFIRSMGSRGHLGGLARSTARAVDVLDALGLNYVFLETVGVGQSELEIAQLADTTVVVLMPGLGDSVQTIKAGIMEIADVFVVNKADHPGTEKAVADLKELMRLDSRPIAPDAWVPPVVTSVATTEQGVDSVWSAIRDHRKYLESSNELTSRRAQRLERQVLDIAAQRLRAKLIDPIARGPEFRRDIEAVLSRRSDPFTVADTLIRDSNK